MADDDANGAFDVETFLRSLKETKPPWECPKCHKVYKSYIGIEYHLQNFDHTAYSLTPNKPASARKSKLKFTKRKKNSRLSRRSPSPIEFFTQTRETLTWAEAQRMVEVESEGRVYRLNIDEKLDIISDSDIDKDDDSSTSDNQEFSKAEESVEKQAESDEKKDEDNTPKNAGKNSTSNKKEEKVSKATSSSASAATKLPKPSYRLLSDYDKETLDAPSRSSSYYRYIEKPAEEVEDEIEYDMDEEDTVWLELMNELRTNDGLSEVTHDQLELLMDRFEKESYFEQEKNGLGAQGSQPPIDENAVCCVCNDGECENSNAILFCDMCNLAVHQECYGVPYIPEGQWLCRRCLQSPSCPVDCCLCPSRSGAFKQTDDGRWAHVVCALWIPEVTFGNTVFLEPIDGLKNVPPARWRLSCYVCKQRNSGACIQCHRTNCYVAFHVTCAQQAGLHMKMEAVRKTGRNGVTVMVKKEAFCDAHTPTNASPRQNKIVEQKGTQIANEVDKKNNANLKKTRKIIAQKRNEPPQISLPHVPKDKIPAIGRRVTIQKKNSFLQRLLSYWTLKRQARSGVPLLRRLQTHVPNKSNDPELNSQQHQLIAQLKYWHRLRHDLERARLLIELIRKRERLKKDFVRISQATVELRLTPFLVLLRRTLDSLEAIDVAEIFAEPVTKSEVPDYHDVIKDPMDFQTMGSKIASHEYRSISEFESDFKLVVDNCLEYNNRDTVFYRLGVKMRDHGGAVVRQAKCEVEAIRIDEKSGMLLPKTRRKSIAAPSNDTEKPLNEQLEAIQERLDQALLNCRKTKRIKAEIASLKKKILQESVNTSRLKRRNITVPNHQGRMTTRRFSADDIEPASNAAESEAVVSDIESNFKISPKIRPVKSNRSSRKRLWSSKADFASWQPSVKRKLLKRTESCPATEFEDSESFKNSCDSANDDTKSNFSSPSSVFVSPSTDKTSSSRENSPSCANSVNRRTAVLFRKKKRRRMSNINSPSSDSTSDFTSDCRTSPEMPKQSDSDTTEVARSKNGPLFNGFDSVYDENVFTSPSSVRRRDSYSGFHEEFSRIGSLTDAHSSSSEKQVSFKKKRSFSCSVTSLEGRQSNNATSSDDQSGFFVDEDSEFPFQFLRRQSYLSTAEEEVDEEDLPQLSPLDLVWAKCRGYPPYPALLIDPKMPRSGFLHNGVPIPVPPMDVMQVGEKRIENGNHRIFLVLFFDTKRTWQWLPRNKLEPLGVDEDSDRSKLGEVRRANVRRNVEAAYNRALHHRKKVTGEIPDSDDEFIASFTEKRD